jgi:hypothetical protein
MTDAEPQKLSFLAKLIVALILALIVAGIVWHGVSIPTFRRIWHDLVARPDAPMRFRFILQPLMAAIVAMVSMTRGPAAHPIFGRCWVTHANARSG